MTDETREVCCNPAVEARRARRGPDAAQGLEHGRGVAREGGGHRGGDLPSAPTFGVASGSGPT